MPITFLNVGTKTVPVQAATTRNIRASDGGKGIVQQAAAIATLTIQPDTVVNLGVSDFCTTLAVSNGAGQINIARGAGVTLRSLVTGADANFSITGVGIVSIWKIGLNSWVIHGTNFV